jgi:hypothetical protein
MDPVEQHQALRDNYTSQSAIFIKNAKGQHIMFANNTFDSNIGIHGGAIHIDNIKQGAPDEDSKRYSPFTYFKNNTFTRNMAYFEGNAIFVEGAQRTRSDRDFVRNDNLL